MSRLILQIKIERVHIFNGKFRCMKTGFILFVNKRKLVFNNFNDLLYQLKEICIFNSCALKYGIKF